MFKMPGAKKNTANDAQQLLEQQRCNKKYGTAKKQATQYKQ